jgi:hypothetical protein
MRQGISRLHNVMDAWTDKAGVATWRLGTIDSGETNDKLLRNLNRI